MSPRASAPVLTILLLALMATPATARSYTSSFGFSTDVPSYWLVLSRKEIQDKSELFEGGKTAGLDPSIWAAIQEQIKAGLIEYWYDMRPDVEKFADNINVRQEPGWLPPRKEVGAVCASLPEQLSAAFGRPIDLHACKLVKMGPHDTLFLDFDGVLPGTRSMQYQVQRSEGVQIQLTATCIEERVAKVQPDLDAAVKAIKYVELK